MVLYQHTGSGQTLNQEWHATRWEAISETYGLREFGEIDIEKYDLDELQFSRKYKESSFISDPRQENEGAGKADRDIRTIPTVD